MKLVVGLGNPGERYERTRHNMGFMALDYLIKEWNLPAPKQNFFSEYWEYNANGAEKILLAKPQTFMNNSGEAVASIMHFYKMSLNDLLVIYDDKDMQFSHLKLKPNGSGAGHNGIKDIVCHLKSEQFMRIKMGIGKDPRVSMVDWVLGKVPKAQENQLQAMWVHVAKMVEALFVKKENVEKVMSLYNS